MNRDMSRGNIFFISLRLTNRTPHITILMWICGVKMSIESNINYLDYEINSNNERIALIEKYLEENPSVSIYKRNVNQKTYYYKKYRKQGKSVSEYLGSDNDKIDNLLEEIQNKNLERKKIKENRKKLKNTNSALEKQLKIARKSYVNG